jgi:pyruvate carboxylase
VPLTPEQRESLEGPDRRTALSQLLFPKPYEEFRKAVDKWGDVSVIPTEAFWYGLRPGHRLKVEREPGVEVLVELETIGEPDEAGLRTLHLRVNGHPRPITVRDRSAEVRDTAARRADPSVPGHVGSPLPGVVMLKVAVGDTVKQGQPLVVVEAMKMESTVTSPRDGTVTELAVAAGAAVEAGDLLVVLE